MTTYWVKDFAEDKEEEKSIWEKILSTEENLLTKMKKDPLHVVNGTNGMPKKWNVDSTKLNGSASVKRDWSNSISTNKEDPTGLEIWKAKKITIWHSVNGNSIQWLCVIYNAGESTFFFFYSFL